MKIKKFTAPTLKDGKLKVAKELGEDAIILSSRRIKLKDNEEELIEIVAAIDDSPITIQRDLLLGQSTLPSKRLIPDKNKISEVIGSTQTDIKVIEKIYNEIDELKDMIFDIRELIKYKYSGILGPVFGKIYKQLRKAEVNDELSLKIAGTLLLKSKIKNEEDAVTATRELITQNIAIDESFVIRSQRQGVGTGFKVAAFIGPTGSGKTSTLMKIAVAVKLIEKSEVMIISTDTYKIGGIEQLQTYSSVAGIPFAAAYSPDELSQITRREPQTTEHRDLNNQYSTKYILIDTVGRSGKNKQGLNDIRMFLKSANVDITYLVLSANMGEASFRDALESFSILNPDALIISKIDECPALGGIISALQNYSIPVAYFTTGQKVPEDIELASKKKLGELLL